MVVAPLLREGMPYEPDPLRAPTYMVCATPPSTVNGADPVRSL
jgi:hypothetical protein